MDAVELGRRFAYHPPSTEEVVELHESMRRTFGNLAEWLDEKLPDCREKSLLMTKLDEACMYANATIARTQLNQETPRPR